MKPILKNLSLALAALGLSACVTPSVADKSSITLPPETAHFKPGSGSDVATTYCTICHSPDYIYMQPAQDRAGWTGAVNKMRKVFGAPIPEEQVKVIVDYLMAQNGKQ
ncbi:MAG: hypothetical protein WCA09_09555 [Burkholderiales bacterium]